MVEAIDLIKRHEGLRLKPYRCTAGKLTIGYGRNLEDIGILEDEAELMLKNDIGRCRYEVNNNIPVFNNLDQTRQSVLLDMCYNLGIKKLLGFKKMLEYLNNHDYDNASIEMLNSEWAKQVPNRARELAQLMKKGGE